MKSGPREIEADHAFSALLAFAAVLLLPALFGAERITYWAFFGG